MIPWLFFLIPGLIFGANELVALYISRHIDNPELNAAYPTFTRWVQRYTRKGHPVLRWVSFSTFLASAGVLAWHLWIQ